MFQINYFVYRSFYLLSSIYYFFINHFPSFVPRVISGKLQEELKSKIRLKNYQGCFWF
nr:MAG TPA: hypothetical protein [Caudoviricetes sp.]